MGFKILVHNFNHERFVIAVSTNRAARKCYEEAAKWAIKRKTFGKRLIDHQAYTHDLLSKPGGP